MWVGLFFGGGGGIRRFRVYDYLRLNTREFYESCMLTWYLNERFEEQNRFALQFQSKQ